VSGSDAPVVPPALERRTVLLGLSAATITGLAPSALWRVAPAGASTDPLGPPTSREVTAPEGAGPVRCVSDPTYDTMAAVAAFVLPGDDVYSQTQGVATPDPGAVAAGAPQFLAMVFDQVLLDPTAITMLLERLGSLVRGVILPDGRDACEAIGSAIEQDGAVPLTPVIVAVINGLSLTVRPASATGEHAAPFARLSWEDKAEVWRRYEHEVPALLEPPVWQLETPLLRVAAELGETLGGIIEYAAGVTLPLAAFFAYSEALVYDRGNDEMTARPVGWDLANYLPGRLRPVDGWDEFRGYYQGRQSVDA
jgi:hypothetical protein